MAFKLLFHSKSLLQLANFMDSYISYLPLAHIYERANQVMAVYFGVAVGFYQGVCYLPVSVIFLSEVIPWVFVDNFMYMHCLKFIIQLSQC